MAGMPAASDAARARPVGGFFELHAPDGGADGGPSVLEAWTEGRPYAAFANARSAFAALAAVWPAAKIWLPAFVCVDVMDGLSPDRIFQKRWAVTLLQQVLRRLGEECDRSGKRATFDALRPQVLGETSVESASAIAARLGLTEGALRVTVHRLRQRYQEMLRQEVGRTVSSADEVDGEIRELVAALRA